MKKLRLLGLCLLVAVSAFTLTSCLNDDNDDDNGAPTPAERAQMFNSVKGAYSGKIYSFGSNVQTGKSELADSAVVACSINTDSTMVLSKVPARFLALAIDTTTTEHKAIRKAVAEQGPVDVNCLISFYKFYEDWNTRPFWFVYPKGVTFNVPVNGTNHKVEIGFWINYQSGRVISYGYMNTSSRVMVSQILIAAAKIDGVESSSSLSTSVPLLFVKNN